MVDMVRLLVHVQNGVDHYHRIQQEIFRMNMILMDHGVYHDVFIDLVEDIIMYVFVILCLIKIDIVMVSK